MAYEQKDNSGNLFKNEEKTDQNPNWPDYKGHGIIGGVEYYLSAWIKKATKGKNMGKSFLSLAFKEKEEKLEIRASDFEPQGQHNKEFPPEPEDDLPF